ncbi:hypothetical protein [Haloarcula sp. JP-L23]|uniref:hypothetical protein n=1 Tax=Haloarcula sp. JP-L23 TaxID=2716717 RepID=UPI00140F32D8|nr:hypothetical protein G9465_22160 [Haloarcula sp. JP-L23]
MSKHVTFYTSDEQKEMIDQMADKRDMSLSQYCVLALDRQLARDVRLERISETDLDQQLEQMQDEVLDEIESTFAPSTEEEQFYGVALWNLLSSEHPSEAQADAMSNASEQLDRGLEKLRQKEDDA